MSKETKKRKNYIFKIDGKSFIKGKTPAKDQVIPFSIEGMVKIKDWNSYQEALNWFLRTNKMFFVDTSNKKPFVNEISYNNLVNASFELNIKAYKK